MATTVKATALGELDILADGAIVLNTSHQLNWFYAQVATRQGRVTRRRYRHDQLVKVQKP